MSGKVFDDSYRTNNYFETIEMNARICILILYFYIHTQYLY